MNVLRSILLVAGTWLVLLSAQAFGDVAVQATCLNGKIISGVWRPSAEPGRLVLRTQVREETLAVEGLMSVRFQHPAATAGPVANREVTVWCHDGSFFAADIAEGGDTHLQLRTPFAERFAVSVNQLAALKWNQHPEAPLFVERLSERRAPTDSLFVRTDNQLRAFEGAIEYISLTGGRFRMRGRSIEFDARKTHGLILARTRKTPPAPCTCHLTDGSVLVGAVVGSSAKSLRLACTDDQILDLNVSSVAELRFSSPRLMYLSDLTPAEVQYRSLFDVPWPMRADRAVSNRPMRMAGRLFEKGIGVHASTEITYALTDSPGMLAATIGIDDLARPGGNVVFRILAEDDRELYTSGSLTGRDQPLDISVSLQGVSRIRLVVESAAGLDIADHANWGAIRLIK